MERGTALMHAKSARRHRAVPMVLAGLRHEAAAAQRVVAMPVVCVAGAILPLALLFPAHLPALATPHHLGQRDRYRSIQIDTDRYR